MFAAVVEGTCDWLFSPAIDKKGTWKEREVAECVCTTCCSLDPYRDVEELWLSVVYVA